MHSEYNLVNIVVDPIKLKKQIKILSLMTALNDEPEFREVLDTLIYLKKAAEAKHALEEEEDRRRRSLSHEHDLYQNGIIENTQNMSGAWTSGTTTGRTPFPKDELISSSFKPFWNNK